MAGNPEKTEIWQECLQWLVDLNVFNEDHAVISDSATWDDLARNLRNGVRLCKLIYNIDPRLIIMENVCTVTANSKLQCMQNIILFLTICVDKLGIKRARLFDPEDFFNMENYGIVWQLLSEISHHEILQNRGISPFPRTASEYSNLLDGEEYSSATGYSRTRDQDHSDYGIYELDREWFYHQYENEEDIYSSLTKYCDTSIAQLNDVPENAFDGTLKSQLAHLELLTTEKVYAEGLILMNSYVKELLTDMVGIEISDQIIYKFNDLMYLHTDLYNDLLHSVPNNYKSMEETFDKFENKLLGIYADYCSKYNDNIKVLTKYTSRYPEVAKKIEEMEQSQPNKRRLKDYLAHPFQRICKYPLLMKTILSHVEKEESTYNTKMAATSLQNTLAKLTNINEFVNVAVGDENYKSLFKKKTFSNYNSLPLSFQDFQGSGRLEYEESVSYSEDEKRLRQERGHIFIFEEGILLCKSSFKKTSFPSLLSSKKGRKPLEFIKLIEIGNVKVQPLENMSQFTITDTSKDKKILFFVRNEQIRENIVSAISDVRTLYEYRIRSKHRFAPITLKLSSDDFNCTICRTHLRGTYCQGYICENCQYVSHSNCINVCRRNNNGRYLSFNEHPCYFKPMPSIGEQSLNSSWWQGSIDKKDCVVVLRDCSPGDFLVRWSEKQESPVLSMKDQDSRMRHVVINFHDVFYLIEKTKEPTFTELYALIEHYKKHSLKTVINTIKVKLRETPQIHAMARNSMMK